MIKMNMMEIWKQYPIDTVVFKKKIGKIQM